MKESSVFYAQPFTQFTCLSFDHAVAFSFTQRLKLTLALTVTHAAS